MKILLVSAIVLVVCMLATSLAAPLREEEAEAVLQAIRMLVSSANHHRSEIQQSGNATTPGPCEVEDSNKMECGYVGITQAECEGRGCCWKESSISGVPFCFHKAATSPQCQTNDRVECGHYGIDVAQCEYRGCCWSPTTASGQPWCYHENALEPECQTDPADRTECGYFGISAQQCKENGCCWNPTSSSGRPWCFTKPTPPTSTTSSPSSPSSSVQRKFLTFLGFLTQK